MLGCQWQKVQEDPLSQPTFVIQIENSKGKIIGISNRSSNQNLFLFRPASRLSESLIVHIRRQPRLVKDGFYSRARGFVMFIKRPWILRAARSAQLLSGG
jgi:hypothetical protein